MGGGVLAEMATCNDCYVRVMAGSQVYPLLQYAVCEVATSSGHTSGSEQAGRTTWQVAACSAQEPRQGCCSRAAVQSLTWQRTACALPYLVFFDCCHPGSLHVRFLLSWHACQRPVHGHRSATGGGCGRSAQAAQLHPGLTQQHVHTLAYRCTPAQGAGCMRGTCCQCFGRRGERGALQMLGLLSM